MPTGLNNDKHDLSRMDGFVNARLSAPGNVLAFMDARTQEPALQEQDETPKASASIYDMDGTLTQEQMLTIQFMGGRAGSSITPVSEQHEDSRKERESKDRERTQELINLASRAQAEYAHFTEILYHAQEQHTAALAELRTARQELAQAEARAAEASENLEAHEESIAEASQERREAVAAVEDKTITIDGRTIRYDKDDNSFKDQEGNRVDVSILEGSDDPEAKELLKPYEARLEEISRMSQRGPSVQAVVSEQAVEAAAEGVEAAEHTVDETAAAVEKAQADQEAAKEKLDNANRALEDHNAGISVEETPIILSTEEHLSPASLEIESSESASPRTVSAAIGETNFVEDNSVKAPNMRGEFKVRAEGTAVDAPETPDASADKNLGQTADLAAAQNNQQFAMTQLRPLGMGTA